MIGPVTAPAVAPYAAPYVVTGNPGGTLQDEARWTFDSAGRAVVIDGRCDSRCVQWAFFLAKFEPGRICVTPRASFGLHQAWRMQGGRVLPAGSVYAAELNAWAAARGGLPAPGAPLLIMSAPEAVALGFRPCTASAP